MRTVIIALLGLIVGFFVGEAVAVLIGLTTNWLFEGPPSGLWILKSLPIVLAISGATALSILDLRLRSR